MGHEEIARAKSTKLHDHARGLPLLGTWELQVAGKTEFKSKSRTGKKKKEHVTRKKRTATMAVSSSPVQLKVSRSKKAAAICVWVVRVWELNPPADQLEWFLITNHPTATLEDACNVVGWYEKRWFVEEYHKCLKTGLSIEGYQFTDTDRLEPAIALTSTTAITLLNLRDDSQPAAFEVAFFVQRCIHNTIHAGCVDRDQAQRADTFSAGGIATGLDSLNV